MCKYFIQVNFLSIVVFHYVYLWPDGLISGLISGTKSTHSQFFNGLASQISLQNAISRQRTHTLVSTYLLVGVLV